MLHAATIFLSSFLLFLVQPLIARLILPWFGGTAAVWTTCMLFFQVLLLAGYGYAHWLAGAFRGRTRNQAVLHGVLLAAAVALLPIAPGESWKPTGAEEPISAILLLLLAAVGLPYFLLASTSPLVQVWFARMRPGADPYRLYAVSNLASLGALVSYPFLFEPLLTGREQVWLWSGSFVLFAVVSGWLAWRGSASREGEGQSAAARKPSLRTYLVWLALAATGSVLLLAVTNHLTQNVAAVPLLWLAPLTLYLLSFILAFDGRGWYEPRVLWGVVLAALGAMGWLLADDTYAFDLAVQLGVFLPGLFLGCLFCHGELYRARPGAQHLTAFYLTLSAGGALGGVLVAVVAPLAFNAYYELGIGLVLLALLVSARYASLDVVARYASVLVLFGVTACAVAEATRYHRNASVAERSFYGVLRVKEWGMDGDESQIRRLMHGAIMHGEQFMHPDKRSRITTYYQESSGIGGAIASRRNAPQHVGVIGLGAGTLAGYGRAGDRYRFYDINPDVVAVARSHFTFLADSKAAVEVVLGDARLSLEREAPQGFDILAVDAFSGDAIPVHLITREALAAFLRHMKPDGIVAFHVSNRFLDLVPVVAGIAKENGVHAVVVRDEGEEDDEYHSRTDWVLVSRSQRALEHPELKRLNAEAVEPQPGLRTWTDDYSNLIGILK